jgi:hypothetical protein
MRSAKNRAYSARVELKLGCCALLPPNESCQNWVHAPASNTETDLNAEPAPSLSPRRHSKRLARLFVLVATPCIVSGCATSSAGVLDGSTGSGGYALSVAEQKWHCGGLENAIQSRVTKIVALDLQAKSESKTVAPTLSRMFTRLVDGPGTDSPALTQIRSERVIADAYNDQLRVKKCPIVDIDAKILKATDAATAAAIAAAAKQAPSLSTKSDGIKPLEPPKGNGLAGTL